MTKARDSGKHHRPSAAELDERIAIPLDPETVIEGMMKVDSEKVREAEPRRLRMVVRQATAEDQEARKAKRLREVAELEREVW